MKRALFCKLVAAAASISILLVQGTTATTIRDAAGRSINVPDASRIVSIGGAITEILYALGQSDRVVAVDTTSLYPTEALKTKPNVGYFRQLSPEGVVGLAPSVIIAVDGLGPRETVAVLEAASIPLVRVPERFDGDGIIDKIRMVAAATGAEKRAVCLEKAVAMDLSALAELRAHIRSPVRALFILSFMNGRAMVAGRGTAADGIMRLAGAVNVFADFEGYKIVNDEAIVVAAPDVVLAMQREGLELDAPQVFAHAAFRETPAARGKRFFAMEGLYMLGFGPRTARAARDLSLQLYPALADNAKLPSDELTGNKPCRF